MRSIFSHLVEAVEENMNHLNLIIELVLKQPPLVLPLAIILEAMVRKSDEVIFEGTEVALSANNKPLLEDELVFGGCQRS